MILRVSKRAALAYVVGLLGSVVFTVLLAENLSLVEGLALLGGTAVGGFLGLVRVRALVASWKKCRSSQEAV